MSFEQGFLRDIIKRFRIYKEMGDKTLAQLEEKDPFSGPPLRAITLQLSYNICTAVC